MGTDRICGAKGRMRHEGDHRCNRLKGVKKGKKEARLGEGRDTAQKPSRTKEGARKNGIATGVSTSHQAPSRSCVSAVSEVGPIQISVQAKPWGLSLWRKSLLENSLEVGAAAKHFLTKKPGSGRYGVRSQTYEPKDLGALETSRRIW